MLRLVSHSTYTITCTSSNLSLPRISKFAAPATVLSLKKASSSSPRGYCQKQSTHNRNVNNSTNIPTTTTTTTTTHKKNSPTSKNTHRVPAKAKEKSCQPKIQHSFSILAHACTDYKTSRGAKIAGSTAPWYCTIPVWH